ncbi:hypothetical protein O1611_g7545 [Lasiodiplodia mahajangana]|uniref:Uncharacterized protein n=1 Tax=Lasiodiplodia mahajangana TaxID=1108764 RepID=A0ACC2JF14_9PEZI|nr:hypothetical protein O1611_g7545 [Lasiodiplodia mahajangana]
MEAMDVDGSGPSQRLALIRAVRTLDEDSSLTLPDKIHKLWLLLTAAKNTRLHGVEESILRWLLKQMSGSTDNAEHVRRFPLTWTILGHVFPKIPAQALGRSLAYLRFVSILNKTLGDVTKQETQDGVPGTEEGAKTSKKRKRGANWPATLDELRTSVGCLRTASEVFEALATLLEQGTAQSGELTPERRVGAEHIKSLFSSSGEETRDITARLLLICDDSLSLADGEPVKGQQSWVDTLTTIWDLRLRSKEDSIDFAKYIYGRASLILAKFEGDYSVTHLNRIYETCREIWTSQLRRFLSTYFIRPARQRFSADKNIDVPKLALGTARDDVVASATAMWSIAATTPRDTSDPKSKIEHDAWIENIFRAVMESLQPLSHQKKNEVFLRLLDIALQTQSIPDTETLRTLYQQHDLDGAETDWALLSKVLACDPDVFLADQDPEAIFNNISKISDSDAKTRDEVVSNVILPLQDAFSNARDLANFVTKWLGSLCAAKPVEQCIWFDSRIREHLATILQTSLSSTQILRLLEGLGSIANDAGELLVVLDGICAGLADEHTIANVHQKIISMMDRKWEDISPGVLALRWRIFGYLASWEESGECNQLWKKVKSDLKPILKKSPLVAAETFEAFSCCYKLCLANHIGGKYEEDLIKLICTTLGRLISSINTEADLQLLRPYLDLVFNHLPRLSEQPKQEVNTLIDKIAKLFWLVSYRFPLLLNEQRLEFIRPLIHNYDAADEEPMADALMAPLLDALDNSGDECGWTQPHSLNLLSILLEFPVEFWTRGRRKRMMSSWKKDKCKISSYTAKDPKYAVSVLRLFIRIMQQPTFYEDMEFADLVDICSDMAASDNTLSSLVERFVDSTIRQILANVNGFTESYLLSASKYAKGLELGKHSESCARILLLKSLTAAISGYRSSNGSFERLGIDPNVFGQRLAILIEQTLEELASGVQKSSTSSLPEEKLDFLSIVLDASRIIGNDPSSKIKIELSGDILTQLERAGDNVPSRDAAIIWKLRAFLIKQNANRYTTESFSALLDECSHGIEEESIHGLIDAYVQEKSQSERDELLGELIGQGRLTGGSIGPLLAARRLLELYQAPNVDDKSTSIKAGIDLAKVHDHFASFLSNTESLPHFKQISETINIGERSRSMFSTGA